VVEIARFVDRLTELKALESWCTSPRATPLYLYGPEGCGKTRLLKEFVKGFSERFEDAVAIYIDALERSSIDRAVIAPRVSEVVRSIVEDIPGAAGAECVGRVVANALARMLERLVARRAVEGRYIVVAVDDVARAIGLDQVEWYVKWLYELLWRAREEWAPKAVSFIVTTSEGASLDLVSRHRHAHISLVWNLGRDAFNELVQLLKPSRAVDLEELWRFLGGNPGRLIELVEVYDWSIDAWMRDLEARLRPFIHEISRRGLLRELRAVIEDPDALADPSMPRMGELYRALVERNLVMYRGFEALGGARLVPDPDLGVGRYYAWQIPAYRYALKRLLEGG